MFVFFPFPWFEMAHPTVPSFSTLQFLHSGFEITKDLFTMKSSSYFQQITMLFDLLFLLFVTALNPIGLNEIRHEPIGDLRNASLIKSLPDKGE